MKFSFSNSVLCLLPGLLLITFSVQGQRDRPKPPPATYANVSYGDHPMQVLDFWQADVGGSGPLVIYIHGGGFRGGSKDRITADTVNRYLSAGIHFASVEYRLLGDALLPAAHVDATRALQFIRSKAREWRIKKDWIGAYGGSAGAQLVAYLAWHDDMADPESEDPIARESTRLTAVAPLNGQATMDLNWWIDNIPGYDVYHRDPSEYFDLNDPKLDELVWELSIINHISSDDPPVFMRYNMKPDDPIPEENPSGWKIHHVNFGIALEDKLRRAGVEVTLKYPGPKTRYESEVDFFIEKLAWQGMSESFKDFEAGTFEASGQAIDYQLLKPRNFNPNKEYPLVVFLHGSGGRGPANIRNLVDASVPGQLASESVHGSYDAFYLVPQCPGPNTWAKSDWYRGRSSSPRTSKQDALFGLVDEIIASQPIDTSRLYITGLSMGGYGTFSAVSGRPNFWAAAAAVCGGWDPSEGAKLSKTPFRLFHGDQDTAVPVQLSRDMFAALKTAGGDVEYTEYPGVKHNSWLKAYWDDSLWQWMFQQKR